jgi:hypothetical protein
LRFAPAESEAVANLLTHSHLDAPAGPATIIVICDPGGAHEEFFLRSDAAIAMMSELRRPWPTIAAIFQLAPRPLRDLAYRIITHFHYRIGAVLPPVQFHLLMSAPAFYNACESAERRPRIFQTSIKFIPIDTPINMPTSASNHARPDPTEGRAKLHSTNPTAKALFATARSHLLRPFHSMHILLSSSA